MTQGVEFDFVVKDSLKALAIYQSIFEVEPIEVTNLPVGTNEAVFSIFGARFHMLDENPEYSLFAPEEGARQTFWFNLVVKDIKETYQKAVDAGCIVIQEVMELPDFGVSNAMFTDPFGYVWMLHQIHREVSFEDRMKLF